MILASCLLALACVVGIPYYLDSRIPRATATVQVHPSSVSLVNPTSYMENEFEIILNPETISLAAEEFDLPLAGEKDEIPLVLESLTAAPVRGTDFIQITAKNKDPKKAAKIANAVARAYAKIRADSERARAQRALQALDDELTAQETLVAKARAELQALGDEPSSLPQDRSTLSQDHSIARSLQENRSQQAKEAFEQSREMLRQMKIKQEEARVLLKMPRDPVTIHEMAR